MCAFKHLRTLFLWLAMLLPLCSFGEVTATSRLSSRFLARGELALLEIAIIGENPTSLPQIPNIPSVKIQVAGRGPTTQSLKGGIYEYQLDCYEIGNHVIPAIEIMVGNEKVVTEPIEFTVFNPDDLKWTEAEVGGVHFQYASAFRVLDPHPYEGETVPVEIKLYMPQDLFVDDWGIPDFKRDGVTAWRFQPSPWRGMINLLGLRHVSVAYPSTLTATRSGKVGIGPANVRLIVRQVELDGYMRRVLNETNINVPKLELETTPLPPNAPDGFDNAIGRYKIETSSSLTSLNEGDPVPIEIRVTGSGNLDTIRPPKPAETTGWKVYEPTADQRGDERRELSGKTIFHQFLRPLEIKSAVPPYRFVFFDPKEKVYNTLTTDAIPLKMLPLPQASAAANNIPQAKAVPIEKMTDILGLLPINNPLATGHAKIPGMIYHLIALALALVLVARAVWLKYGYKLHKDPVRTQRLKELREIENLPSGDDTQFLLAAGRFIERWSGKNTDADALAVLKQRDDFCFRKDRSHTALLDAKHRATILQTLRKAALIGIFSLLSISKTDAEDIPNQAKAAYESANYSEAIKLWLSAGKYEELSADTLYNIADACYRAGSPGHAALYYRRALARNASHEEARQNLRFIERKYGSIIIHRPEYQYALTKLSLHSWQAIVWSGVWMCILAVLVFPATSAGAKVRIAAAVALIAGPLLIISGGLGWWYYPSDAEFAPLHRQAVIIGEKAILHTDASRTTAEVIDAPPGSLCEVIRESGRWSYVAFATKTRGWVPSDCIEKIIPVKTPTPPAIRKPNESGSSA